MLNILVRLTLILSLGPIFNSNAQYLDDSFSPSFTKESYIDYARKNSDKVILGGDFNFINTTACNGVAVLNEDRTIYNVLEPDQLENVRPFYILASSDSLILLNDRSNTYIMYHYHSDSVSYLNLNYSIRAASFSKNQHLLVSYYDLSTDEVVLKKIDAAGNEISGFEPVIFDHNVEVVEVLSNEKIAVAGSFGSINNDPTYQKLALLTSEGQIDSGFNAGYELSSYISQIKEGESGELFLTGYFPTNNSAASESLVKLNNDGSVDADFSLSVVLNSFSRVTDVYTDSNGAVYVTGSTPYNTTGDFKLLRLNANGRFDPTFEPLTASNKYFTDGSLKALITPLVNDQVLLTGNFNETQSGLSSSLAVVDGSGVEVNTELQAYSAAQIKTSSLLNNKNILLGGEFRFLNGDESLNGLEMITPSGEKYSEFNLDDRIIIKEVSDAILTEEENIIVAGLIEYKGQRKKIIRLLNDGSLDTSFILSEAPSSSLVDIAYVKSSKSIYAIFSGGNHSLVKYDSTGNLDESFSIDNQLPDDFSPINIFPDVNNELFISGYISIDGVLKGGELHKITANGEKISSFEVNNISQSISELVRLSDSTLMYLGGFVTSFSTSDQNPVYIINNDGEIIDQYSFALRGGENINGNIAKKIVLNNDSSKAYILGHFNYINDYNSGQIAEINLDFSIEENTSFYSDGYILDAIIDHETNELLVFGDFSTINNSKRSGAAKITLDNFVPVLVGLKQPIEILEDTPFVLQTDDLIIKDKDYDNHELIIKSGEFYSLEEGNEIVPERDYDGLLKIPISVTDQRDSSNTITLEVKVTPVNDIPQFVGYSVLETHEDSSVILKKNYFQIEDPDTPLKDISINFEEGENYSIENDSIMVPDENFSGSITIPFHLSDGVDQSEQYSFPIEILPVNDSPIIVDLVDQVTLGPNTRYQFSVNDFVIEDPDNSQEDFQIMLYDGENYEVQNNIMILGSDFSGVLSVSASVNDGIDESNVFQFPVEVSLLLPNKSEIPFQELSFYPNPTHKNVSLFINDPFIGTIKVSVIDLSGAQILKRNFLKSQKEIIELINIENLKTGIYYITVVSDDKKLTSIDKIVVSH